MTMTMENKTAKELATDHIDFVLNFLKGRPDKEILPMAMVCKGNEIGVIAINGDRETIHKTIQMIKSTDHEWFVLINEAYMRTEKKKKNHDFLQTYEHGKFEQQFKEGDKAVKEIVMIQASKGDDRHTIIIDKATKEIIMSEGKEGNFSGYLAL